MSLFRSAARSAAVTAMAGCLIAGSSAARPCADGVPCAFIQVASGGDHALGLASDGSVWAWGANASGQIGDGTTVHRSTPVRVRGVGGVGWLQGIVHVAAGLEHSLAVTTSGEVRAWGDNEAGQLGDATRTDSLVPVIVQAVGGGGALSDISQVAAGGQNSLALTRGGQARAWGSNNQGRLGTGTIIGHSATPVVVGLGAGLSGIVRLAVSSGHSLAVMSDGGVFAWGWNGFGQLGDGTTTFSLQPVPVRSPSGAAPLTGIVRVAAGSTHSLAVTVAGEVLAWGDNSYAALGDGTTSTPRLLPISVVGTGGTGLLADIADVSAGESFSLAVTTFGEARSWGRRGYGRLGDGQSGPPWLRSTPAIVLASDGGALTAVASVAAGRWHAMGLRTDATIVGWGWNAWGQIADGTSGFQIHPTCLRAADSASGLPKIVVLATGRAHSLGITDDGRVLAWGSNDFGELGDGTLATPSNPVFVRGVGGAGELADIVQVAAGSGYSLAVTSRGEVVSWGRNDRGQLGDGSRTDRRAPALVQDPSTGLPLAGIRTVAAEGSFSLALTADGEIRSWGSNAAGQLGDGTSTDRLLPVSVSGEGGIGKLTNVVAIAAGTAHSLALLEDGEVRGWGFNERGRLGDGTETMRLSPVVVLSENGVSPLTGIASVDAGMSHSLAVTDGGAALSWGDDFGGQLGNASGSWRSVPGPVMGPGGAGTMSGIVAVAAGWTTSVALTRGGEVIAWGSNGPGGGDRYWTPEIVSGVGGFATLTDVKQAGAGEGFRTALTRSGEVRGWGGNDGQLGDGHRTENPFVRPSRCAAASSAPLVSAGPDRFPSGCATAFVPAGAAEDPDGDDVSYEWTSDCGAWFSDAAVAAPFVIIPPGCGAPCTLTLTVTDSTGRAGVDEFVATVEDFTPPTIACPSRVDAVPMTFASALVDVRAIARDACDPAPAISNDFTPDGASAAGWYLCGSTRVVFTAIDCFGNASTCSTDVVVAPAAPPESLSPALRVSKTAAGAVRLHWETHPLEPHVYAEIRRTTEPASRPYPRAGNSASTEFLDRSTPVGLVFWQVHARDCAGGIAPALMLPSP